MRQLLIICILCVGCITAVDAQSVFTQRIQQSNSGEGKVTITQEKAIDDLVNGKTGLTVPTVPQKQTENNTTATNHQEKPERLTTTNKTETTIKTETTTVAPDTIDTRKKLMKGYKINGFRVQVFAGGNSRSDRLKAEKIGDEIKTLYPGTPVYVHFYSPRWICRMGNYRTYEEAHEVLRNVKQLGYQSAIIVKGKITVQYP
ncbi:MAG: SPOR domain-containing protein [Prevotella sp.]|nr:SPOR domain-containing protein [Prevotella sp.]